MSEKTTPAGAAPGASSAPAAKAAPALMSNVTNKADYFYKAGPVYLHKNVRVDLRTVDANTALTLANDPACAFIQFKDEKRRPQGQRNAFPEGWTNPS